MSGEIIIGGRLHSVVTGNVVAGANEVLDDSKGKKQSEINSELYSLISTPKETYMTVSSYAELPATGSRNTIYRVSSWDGTAVNNTMYSEYAWDGTEYILLNVKSQIVEVFDISQYNTSATYADLSDALGTDGANVPSNVRSGGMSVKFINYTTSKYERWRYMGTSIADADFSNVDNWQGVDDEPTANSSNLVQSGGVYKTSVFVSNEINDITTIL